MTIEVTQKMKQDLAAFYISDLSQESMKKVVESIIELHEANKPPREPLNLEQVNIIVKEVVTHLTILDLVRAVEKAHGIGVK